MVYFTPQDAIELFGGNEGKQALDYLTRNGYGSREYLVNGEWLTKPEGSVNGFRYRTSIDKASVIGKTWKYFRTCSVEQPEKPDKILEQMIDAYLKPGMLRLFSPWGPRYRNDSPRIKKSDPEIATLKEMFDVLRRLTAIGYKPNLLLMPADLYGTEINDLPEQFVRDYFSSLEELAAGMFEGVSELTVKPWSRIRDENAKLYSETVKSVKQNFDGLVKPGEFEKAVRVSKLFGSNDPEESARRYCIERLAEAEVVNGTIDPIKLSLVRKEKDALDGPLKRIYVIRNRAPWLEVG